jgi:hypothetical protein
MLDLDTRVDFDKVMTTLLIDQELGGTGVTVLNGVGELDSVVQDGLTDIFGKVRCGSNLDYLYDTREVSGIIHGKRSKGGDVYLLVTTLNGTITLEEVNTIVVAISQQLNLDMTRTVQETYRTRAVSSVHVS